MFQRTPQWIFPLPDFADPADRAARARARARPRATGSSRRSCASPTGSSAARRSRTTGGDGSSTRVARANLRDAFATPSCARSSHRAMRRCASARSCRRASTRSSSAPTSTSSPRAISAGRARGSRHRGRRDPCARRPDPRDRLRGPQLHAADRDPRRGRAHARRGVGERPARLPDGLAHRLPQPVHAARTAQPAEHDLHPRERRAAVRLRDADARVLEQRRHRLGRADDRGDRAVAVLHPRRDAGHGLGERVQQLVPRRRRHAGAVAVRPAGVARGAAPARSSADYELVSS